ncbi:traB domain-containing protein-like [Paramacrobiotus metropolitanus]|uniref:traB domain-containing protein-like n=1 Tax=Paramacrobiotus metropolitanus TaxID=2943436 RepID=UPI0024463C07|nr:traB domain-containing protein-like [Paramacrobiotus metropolitanus]
MERVKSVAKEIGFLKAIMAFFVLKLAAVYVEKFGLEGGDMRTAYREAGNIPHCTLQLGDRRWSITSQRAMNPLSLWERLQCVGFKIRTMRTVIFSPENVETRRWRAVVEELQATFAAACPTVYRAIVQERDVWLAGSLQQSVSQPVLTAEGPRGRVTVGVVGIAHVAGIQRAWNNPPLSPEEMANLETIPPPSAFQMFAPGVVTGLWLSLCGYGAYRGGRFAFNRMRRLYRYLSPARPTVITVVITKRHAFPGQRGN